MLNLITTFSNSIMIIFFGLFVYIMNYNFLTKNSNNRFINHSMEAPISSKDSYNYSLIKVKKGKSNTYTMGLCCTDELHKWISS